MWLFLYFVFISVFEFWMKFIFFLNEEKWKTIVKNRTFHSYIKILVMFFCVCVWVYMGVYLSHDQIFFSFFFRLLNYSYSDVDPACCCCFILFFPPKKQQQQQFHSIFQIIMTHNNNNNNNLWINQPKLLLLLCKLWNI